ncbi:MAG: NAD(P)-dependent oxidoreductase [Cyclobacteriaceae bacterium]|nr:NAD(P)-dependent oxidoreductase [Cytophagales bacterium]MCZ8327965.1 NAD(P)-dependent oxidoreductase [Cyclobacteriaceae bacterium]
MILLTGASGFIGKHLVTNLQNKFGKHNVICFTSAPVEHANYVLHNQYNFESDILTKAGYAPIEVVIHAGSFTPKTIAQQNQFENCISIINNTQKLLSLHLPYLKKFILLSTLDVYQPNININENSFVNPTTFYGQSKLYQEHVVRQFCKANKIAYTIARLGHIYGPGEEAYQKLIPTVFQRIIQQQPIEIFGNEEDLRSFLYVEDACSVISNLLHTTALPELINVVSETSISIKKIIETILFVTGSNVSIVKSENKQVPLRSLSFENTLMRKYLMKEETSLTEGLQQEWNYLKSKYA